MNKIPITKPYIGEEEMNAVSKVLLSGWLVQGEKVSEFEKRVAEHENVKYCCAVTSCTTALQLSMLAEGMTTGMDVLVPSYTFVATANAVVSTGATPVLLDVDEKTFNIDGSVLDAFISENYVWRASDLINRNSGHLLWGIVPVHQFGLCADMQMINEIAKKYKIKVIEDAACALGSKIDETNIGNWGNTACVSFHPRKSITTGEGGMILTNDEEIYQKVVKLRNHGSSVASSERHKSNVSLLPRVMESGFNYRMTDIQGAIGCEQMKKLDFVLKQRREAAEYYNRLLEGKSNLIRIPVVPEGYYHTYQSYVCYLNFAGDIERAREKRNNVMRCMDEAGIATRQGTHAVHTLDYYQKRFGLAANDLPIAYKCDSLTVSIPLFTTITKEEQEWVVEKLLKLVDEQEEA